MGYSPFPVRHVLVPPRTQAASATPDFQPDAFVVPSRQGSSVHRPLPLALPPCSELIRGAAAAGSYDSPTLRPLRLPPLPLSALPAPSKPSVLGDQEIGRVHVQPRYSPPPSTPVAGPDQVEVARLSSPQSTASNASSDMDDEISYTGLRRSMKVTDLPTQEDAVFILCARGDRFKKRSERAIREVDEERRQVNQQFLSTEGTHEYRDNKLQEMYKKKASARNDLTRHEKNLCKILPKIKKMDSGSNGLVRKCIHEINEKLLQVSKETPSAHTAAMPDQAKAVDKVIRTLTRQRTRLQTRLNRARAILAEAPPVTTQSANEVCRSTTPPSSLPPLASDRQGAPSHLWPSQAAATHFPVPVVPVPSSSHVGALHPLHLAGPGCVAPKPPVAGLALLAAAAAAATAASTQAVGLHNHQQSPL
jgi:hypothetical protein